MLSRRAVSQLPRGVTGRLPPRIPTARQFGTSPRSGLLPSRSLARANIRATPLAIPAASRNLSLWPFGKKPEPEPAAPIPEAPTPATPTSDASSFPSAPASAPEGSVTGTDVDFSHVPELLDDPLANIPDGIGQLHALGLDFGYGFTSIAQWLMEHIHVWTGMGWGGAIVLSAFAIRAVTFPFIIKGQKFTEKMQRMQADPRSKELTEMMQQTVRSRDWTKQQAVQLKRKQLAKEYDVNMRNILWNFVPIPFTYGLFRIITAMAALPVPGMETQGFLWFLDLTAKEYYLPALNALGVGGAVTFGMMLGPASSRKAMPPKYVAPVISTLVFLASMWFTNAVNLMGLAFSASMVVSNIVMYTPAFRRAVGLKPRGEEPVTYVAPTGPTVHRAVSTAAEVPNAPVYSAPTPRSAAVETPTASSLRERCNEAKDGFNAAVKEKTGGMLGSDAASTAAKAEQRRKDTLKMLEQTRRQQEKEAFEAKHKGRR